MHPRAIAACYNTQKLRHKKLICIIESIQPKFDPSLYSLWSKAFFFWKQANKAIDFDEQTCPFVSSWKQICPELASRTVALRPSTGKQIRPEMRETRPPTGTNWNLAFRYQTNHKSDQNCTQGYSLLF